MQAHAAIKIGKFFRKCTHFFETNLTSKRNLMSNQGTGRMEQDDLQAGNDDIKHGCERLSAISNTFVNNNTCEPDKQRPWKEENTMQGAQPQSLG